MFEISIAKKTGIAVVDTFINQLSQIAKDANSNAFKTMFLFYNASKKNSNMNAQITKLVKADGTKYNDFVEWACDTYGLKKSAIYSYSKVGAHVLHDENTDTYYYTALRDSMKKCKYNPETGACEEITYPGFSFDIPTFSPSACEILATLDYEVCVTAIKDGTIRVEMSVRELKAVVKGLKKGVSVEETTDSEQTENTETESTENKTETAEEKAEKMVYITKAMQWATKHKDTFFDALDSADFTILYGIFTKTAQKIEKEVESDEKV